MTVCRVKKAVSSPCFGQCCALLQLYCGLRASAENCIMFAEAVVEARRVSSAAWPDLAGPIFDGIQRQKEGEGANTHSGFMRLSLSLSLS